MRQTSGSEWLDKPQTDMRDHALVYRLNTFPLLHLNFFHALFNTMALTPLMERFEAEFGTLTSLALFFGRKSS